jgi:hypothetical protein
MTGEGPPHSIWHWQSSGHWRRRTSDSQYHRVHLRTSGALLDTNRFSVADVPEGVWDIGMSEKDASFLCLIGNPLDLLDIELFYA